MIGIVDYPSPQSLTIEVVPGSRQDIHIIRLQGPLTIHNFQEFQRLTRREPQPNVTLVDLREVPYLDSAALGTFVGIHVACEENGRKYALVGANDRLKALFDLSNVTDFLVIYDSLAEAEAKLL
jgi:anti-anti-sigma factor